MVVIHAGANDIRTRRGQTEQTNVSIAKEQIGHTCRQVGGFVVIGSEQSS